MQSTHPFPLKVPLQLSCSSQIRRALMQMLTCRCLENIQSIVLSCTIPQASVTYCRQDFWIGNNTSSPVPECDLEIIVVWNKEAQRMLFDRTHGGVQPCLMPYPRQFSSHAHIHPLRMRQK